MKGNSSVREKRPYFHLKNFDITDVMIITNLLLQYLKWAHKLYSDFLRTYSMYEIKISNISMSIWELCLRIIKCVIIKNVILLL